MWGVEKIDDAFRLFLFKHNGKTRKIRPFFSNSIIPVNCYSKFELKKLLSTPKWKGGLFFLDHNVFIHARIFCHIVSIHIVYIWFYYAFNGKDLKEFLFSSKQLKNPFIPFNLLPISSLWRYKMWHWILEAFWKETQLQPFVILSFNYAVKTKKSPIY